MIECMSIKEKEEIKERIIEEILRLCERAKEEHEKDEFETAIQLFFETVGLVKALSYMGYFYYVTSKFELKKV